MSAARAIYHVMRADLFERVRRPSHLLLAAAWFVRGRQVR